MGRGPRVKRRKPPAEEAQPFDTFEAEDQLPAEEQPKNVNKRYDVADGLEFELPSDVEDDEEIDEDMAFTEEDKIRYAGMFGDDADGGSDGDGGSAHDDDLLASDASEGEDIHPDDLSDEEQPAGEHSDDEGRHAAMLADVRAAAGAGSKRKRRDIVVSEAYPESEYNLNPASASAGGEGGELQLSDLIKGLGSSRSKLGAARKTLERLERRSGVVAAPLPGNVQARQERKAAYEVTSQDVTKWQPMVKANREAPTLAFSKPRGGAAKATTTAALTAQHAPETDMEAEVAAMLQAAGVHSAKAVGEAEDALALKALSAEESQARRDRLAKMRALLFYHERKAARMKAIKSKEYRRRTNRAERRKAAKAGDGTGEALREAAEEAEFERAKERLTLKHKNTSKWAKRALRRGINVMDEATKDAMQEQLRLGMQLRQKVEQPQSSESDSDGSTSASDEEEGVDDSRDGSGALAPAGDESGAAGRQAKRKPAYSKSRAAALDLLQDGDGDAGEQKGLFALPFMRRAAEQQRAAATQDAAALLRSIEAEVAGVPEDELQQDGESNGAQGRFSFRTGAAFEQNGSAAAAAQSSDDDSEAGEHEDAEAKSQRLARARRKDAATAAHFGKANGSASGNRPAAAPAVDLPASRPDSTAQPSNAAPAMSPGPASPDLQSPAAPAQQAFNAAQLSAGRRNDHLFGGGPSAPQQQGQRQQQGQQLQPKDVDTQRGGVSIGPASRMVSASLASGPAAAAANGAAAAAAAAAAPEGRAGPAAPAAASGDGRHKGGAAQAEAPAGGSEDEGNDGLPSDAMRPAPGGKLSQRELIAMAFAGDDVAADFAAQKAAEAEEEMPAVDTGPGTLPGWGSWANSKRMQREAEAAALKAKQQKAAALAKRKDAKQAHVVISEKWDRKVQKYAAAAVPFPFDGRDTYERSIRQPLGADFNTNASFRNLTRPAVIKEAGLLIQPLKYSKAASDKTAGGGRGPRPAKGDGPSKSRPRVKVLAGGMPRN